MQPPSGQAHGTINYRTNRPGKDLRSHRTGHVISNTARNRSIVHYLIECAALEVTIRSKKMLWFIFCVVDLNKHRSYIDKPMTFENAFHLL